MAPAIDLHGFVSALNSSLPDVDAAIHACDTGLRSRDDVAKVVASSIMFVLREIQSHLSYFEDNISRSFGGISTDDECSRIRDAIVLPFAQKLAQVNPSKQARDSVETELRKTVAELIDAWVSLPKDNSVEEILKTANSRP
jgi:hypothetical protein